MSDSESGSPPPPSEGVPVPAPLPLFNPIELPVPSAAVENAPPAEPLPTTPAIPTLPAPPLPPEPARVGALLLTAVIVMGLLQFVLTILAPVSRATDFGAAFRFGQILGGTVFVPALVIAVFSIGRRFRNARSRAIILLIVWGLAGFTAGEKIAKARQRATMRNFVESVRNANPLEPAEPAAPESEAAAPAAPPAGDAAPGRGSDFSAGSDERLSSLIEHAHETEYHGIVAGYARACAARPDDATLALERVRFTARFLYSEDFDIESASDDHEAAVDHLTRRFPDAPGTVLYQLESIADTDVEAVARKHLARVPRWPGPERAKFFLLRAETADRQDDSVAARRFARDSFTAHPTPAAGLLLARTLHAAELDANAREILLHPVFESAVPWEKKQKMDLLFDLEEHELALALHAELQQSLPQMLHGTDLATRLARAGQVDAARALFTAADVNDWNRDEILRARLHFEFEYGTAEHALQAYRDRRAAGLMADPVLRDRLTLFWKHPGLGWNADDIIGAIVLGLIFAVAFACPLLVFAPVHYWSLLRTRRGRPSAWPAARWGLRQAWVACGVLVLAEVVAVWWFAPDLLLLYVGEADVETVGAVESILAMQVVVWLTGFGVLGFFWWRGRAGRLLGPGIWSFGKAVGVGCGIMLLLRLGLRMYILIWPGAVGFELAAAVSLEVQLYRDLLEHTGTAGLLFIVAGFVPVAEEMLFRGILLQALAKHIPFGWANFLQALGFALMHENVALLPFFLGFGVACGLLARRSGGLLASIGLHASNNFLACFAVLRLQSLMT